MVGHLIRRIYWSFPYCWGFHWSSSHWNNPLKIVQSEVGLAAHLIGSSHCCSPSRGYIWHSPYSMHPSEFVSLEAPIVVHFIRSLYLKFALLEVPIAVCPIKGHHCFRFIKIPQCCSPYQKFPLKSIMSKSVIEVPLSFTLYWNIPLKIVQLESYIVLQQEETPFFRPIGHAPRSSHWRLCNYKSPINCPLISHENIETTSSIPQAIVNRSDICHGGNILTLSLCLRSRGSIA